MYHIVWWIDELKHSHFVVLLKNRLDFEKYHFFRFEKNIIDKVEKIFKEQKNTVFTLFVGNHQFEEVTFFFYLDTTKEVDLFLWEHISQIKDHVSFEYAKDNLLLNHIVLWKYDYDEFKSEKKDISFQIVCEPAIRSDLEERLSTLLSILDARDLVNKPSCEKTPDKYVRHIKNMYFKNTKIKVLDYEEIKKLWLGLLEAVWRAGASKPKLVILEKIVDKKLPTHGFVGKWIIFDTGGLNIKTGDHMYNMKDDMAGSASLLYMMKNLDEKKLPFNIVCALPLAENSIASDAYRPGDIYKSYSGHTVEIINTDAEWRLVLADAMAYISKNYSLQSITSVATLTGACMVALWYNYAGIMGNNAEFIQKALQNSTFEKYWQLPFHPFYIEKTKGSISDLKNLSDGVYAWSTMWGAFLANFCLKWEAFTHIDIAGVSFVKEKYGLYNVGATGFWVDSLSDIVLNYWKWT